MSQYEDDDLNLMDLNLANIGKCFDEFECPQCKSNLWTKVFATDELPPIDGEVFPIDKPVIDGSDRVDCKGTVCCGAPIPFPLQKKRLNFCGECEQAGWKICPKCGYPVAPNSDGCEGCKMIDDKYCPNCGATKEERRAQKSGNPYIACSNFSNCGWIQNCSFCGALTAIRENKETGKEFLGCSRFPKCRWLKALPKSGKPARASNAVCPTPNVTPPVFAVPPTKELFLIAGPCAIESEAMVLETAAALKDICGALSLPLIFKSSFDKANRTSIAGGRGVGREQGLAILSKVREQLALPVLTDVHAASEVAEVAAVVDVLQIPAFLCRQTDLIVACAQTGKPINIKKGQFLAPSDMRHVVAKVRSVNERSQVLVCERGSTFGYHDLVVDMRGLMSMRATGCPIVFDATHSAQQPGAGDGHSGGAREMIPALARAACAVGISGLFIETHPNPADAISDAATQWQLDKLPALLESLLTIHRAAVSHAHE